MSTRAERDHARIRCLAVAINSLQCEMARVVQCSEEPEKLEVYAHEHLARGERGGDLFGLNVNDLTELLGSIAGMEKLVSMGYSVEHAHLMIEAGGVGEMDAEMWKDLLLYLDGIAKDRPPETTIEA